MAIDAPNTQPGDSPRAARRRVREQRVISQMVGMYCKGNHADRTRTHRGHAGDPLCEECSELDAFAVERTRGCRQMEHKTSCEKCGNHCYTANMRGAIRAVMRYSGPRMMFEHPLEALRHALGR